MILLKIEKRKGWPDRLLLTYGRAVWIEFKSEKGRLAPLQAVIVKRLRNRGFITEIVRTKEHFMRILNELEAV